MSCCCSSNRGTLSSWEGPTQPHCQRQWPGFACSPRVLDPWDTSLKGDWFGRPRRLVSFAGGDKQTTPRTTVSASALGYSTCDYEEPKLHTQVLVASHAHIAAWIPPATLQWSRHAQMCLAYQGTVHTSLCRNQDFAGVPPRSVLQCRVPVRVVQSVLHGTLFQAHLKCSWLLFWTVRESMPACVQLRLPHQGQRWSIHLSR